MPAAAVRFGVPADKGVDRQTFSIKYIGYIENKYYFSSFPFFLSFHFMLRPVGMIMKRDDLLIRAIHHGQIVFHRRFSGTIRRVLPADGAVPVRRVLRAGDRAGTDEFIRVIAVPIRGYAHAVRRVLPADGTVLIRRVRIAARGTGANRLALRLGEFFRQHRKSDG